MSARPPALGFTLIELLVVLLLLGLSAAMVGPNMFRALEAQEERRWRAELREYLERQPVIAFDSARRITLDELSVRNALPTLPSRVGLHLPASLQYTPLGVASGGRLELDIDGTRETWQIEPVTGAVKLGHAP